MAKAPKPHGREEVMAAVLDSAEHLFSRHGFAEVSMREIAARARVNLGLLVRHFGTKENLRKQVQDRLSRRIRREIGEPGDFAQGVAAGLRALETQSGFWKVMARNFLSGRSTGEVQSEFPYLEKMVKLTASAQEEGTITRDIPARLIVAGGLAMALGMMVFEPYILQGLGLEDEPPGKMKNQILSAWAKLLEPQADPTTR